MNKFYLSKAIFLIWVFISSNTLYAADNMYFHGILVEEPCSIKPGDETVELSFGNIPDKNLYAYKRTPNQPFQIHLSDCDISIGKNVQITFTGNESQPLPGYLNIDATSQASGIVVGIETPDGKLFSINKESQKYPLSTGDTYLLFNAFIQGEPDAIANKTIERGLFSAIATFNLNYD